MRHKTQNGETASSWTSQRTSWTETETEIMTETETKTETEREVRYHG